MYEQSKSPDPRLQGRNRLADVAARSGKPFDVGQLPLEIDGVGRPSVLEGAATKKAGRVVDTYIGGRCVPMLSGTIDLT